jgi:AraC family transcriptional regulator of adaptative response/methylated-DNA-[protein]-cysteine methyltransferase
VTRPPSSDDARWAAVTSRDPAADGVFFYGVRSTGIYCRPTCPARRPSRSKVAFFETTEAAEAQGFRPCRRCRPGEAKGGPGAPPGADQGIVARVRHLLDTADPPPSLGELSEAVGLSPSHLQRLFKRATGLSPKQYADARRVEQLKSGLRQGATVTAALYDAGYGSSRALYDKAGERLGMSPGAYRRGGLGVTVRFTLADTPLGPMLLAATTKGICALRFAGGAPERAGVGGPDPGPVSGPDREDLLRGLREEFSKATLVEDARGLDRPVQAVLSYLRGDQHRLDLTADLAPTAFQQKVWKALQAIPYGETRSYAEVAEAIGRPTATRAVARACAANPVALVVPCHRVVRADGGLAGYRWGADRKRRLLEQEGAVRERPE